MPHERRIVTCSGPEDPHAFEGIALRPRSGELDRPCPVCLGHGAWNAELDLASLRARRALCGTCGGRGWIETGDDPVPHDDIDRGPDGAPRWTVVWEPGEDRA